jgi:hypothetical protein
MHIWKPEGSMSALVSGENIAVTSGATAELDSGFSEIGIGGVPTGMTTTLVARGSARY